MCEDIQDKIDILHRIFDYCMVEFDMRNKGNVEDGQKYEVGLRSRSTIHNKVGFSSDESGATIRQETVLCIVVPDGENVDEWICETVLDLMSFGEINGIYEFDKETDSISCLFKIPSFDSLSELKIQLDLLSLSCNKGVK